MTDTPIADAWLKHYHGNMFDHNIRAAYAAERAWNASARAIIAQIKPFIDEYRGLTKHVYQPEGKHGSNCVICGVYTNAKHYLHAGRDPDLDTAYQSHVKPLLKELEE